MEKAKEAVIGLLRAMQKRADMETARGIGELISTIESWQPAQHAA